MVYRKTMVYCKLNTTEYDEHFIQSLEKIINNAVALGDDYLIQDDVAEAMGDMLDKLHIEYKWISVLVALEPCNWNESGIVGYLHLAFPDAKYIRIYQARAQYLYIDVDGVKYRLTREGDIDKVKVKKTK